MTHAAPPELRLWRAFPWDADASAGQPFSAEYIPPTQWSGRFDLGGRPRVLYLAESPAQAVGEKLQRFRGQELDWPELNEFGRRLALVEVAVMFDPAHTLANLSDPAELVRYNCRPDESRRGRKPYLWGAGTLGAEFCGAQGSRARTGDLDRG